MFVIRPVNSGSGNRALRTELLITISPGRAYRRDAEIATSHYCGRISPVCKKTHTNKTLIITSLHANVRRYGTSATAGNGTTRYHDSFDIAKRRRDWFLARSLSHRTKLQHLARVFIMEPFRVGNPITPITHCIAFVCLSVRLSVYTYTYTQDGNAVESSNVVKMFPAASLTNVTIWRAKGQS